jgi:hypothetical protein
MPRVGPPTVTTSDARVTEHDAVVASACEQIIRLRDGQIVDEITVPRNVDLDDVLERISRLDPNDTSSSCRFSARMRHAETSFDEVLRPLEERVRPGTAP